ncbi:MAG: hypothetical protein AVDCRST_MAG25-1982, partial [uncultured Rubrobacteraceae bacterium]
EPCLQHLPQAPGSRSGPGRHPRPGCRIRWQEPQL